LMTRVDVFSTKGGVGKTTISFLLASIQAEKGNKPVLLVDADLTGTCLGDLIQPWAEPAWHSRMNLIHLICTAAPERLKDLLRDELPVYQYQQLVSAGKETTRLSGRVPGNTLLFCPSHAYATQPAAVPAAVLHALLGHESAGGWVQYVIEELIRASREVVGELGGVIVDHGPGIGALQDAILQSLKVESPEDRRLALVVTSRDGVDLAATAEFEQRHLDKAMRAKVVWAVNRVKSSHEADWRQQVKQGLSESVAARVRPGGQERNYWQDWFEMSNCFPLFQDEDFAGAYARSEPHEAKRLRQDLEPLRARIFGS
jgi:hypothetical protein